jgi:hypothetical protein
MLEVVSRVGRVVELLQRDRGRGRQRQDVGEVGCRGHQVELDGVVADDLDAGDARALDDGGRVGGVHGAQLLAVGVEAGYRRGEVGPHRRRGRRLA